MTDEQLEKLIDAITFDGKRGFSLFDLNSKLSDISDKLDETNDLLKKLIDNDM